MKYSLYTECIQKFGDIKFSREELDIIQSIFHISAFGNINSDNSCITKSVNNFKYDFFKIHKDSIEYITQDTNFWYLNAGDLKCAHLDLKKADGVYFVHIKDNELSIKFYDSFALSCVQERFDNVKINYRMIEFFNAMGILPDKEYEQNIDLSVLNHFNIINLLMTMDNSFYKLFNGDNIDDLLDKQEFELVKMKIK